MQVQYNGQYIQSRDSTSSLVTWEEIADSPFNGHAYGSSLLPNSKLPVLFGGVMLYNDIYIYNCRSDIIEEIYINKMYSYKHTHKVLVGSTYKVQKDKDAVKISDQCINILLL